MSEYGRRDEPGAARRPDAGPRTPVRDALRQKAEAEHKEALAARKSEDEARAAEAEDEFNSQGYEDTLPGQEEIVAGTPAHVELLSAYPNATSYGPDVNVVVAPDAPPAGTGVGGAPSVVDVPHATQNGDLLSCTMGNWMGEPTSYTYAWKLDGADVSSDPEYTVTAEDEGKSAVCVVSASNDIGTTAAPPSNAVIVAAV